MDEARSLVRLANDPILYQWCDSIWGKSSTHVRIRYVADAPAVVGKDIRLALRMPDSRLKELLARDGYHCRFCGIPVIRREVRDRFRRLFPEEVPWSGCDPEKHAAFITMWAQYDHIVPHSRGGTNDPDNLVVACAPCNFGRTNYTLDEVGLSDPRLLPVKTSNWDGLERMLAFRQPS